MISPLNATPDALMTSDIESGLLDNCGPGTYQLLRQAHPESPDTLRMDASPRASALEAGILQGEPPDDERPVEYASHLLSPAEDLSHPAQSPKDYPAPVRLLKRLPRIFCSSSRLYCRDG